MRYPLLPLAAVLALLLHSPVGAQDFPEVRLGTPVQGTLQPGGPALSSRGAFVVHRFEARAGVRYQVELRSRAFDAYLILARPVGGLTEFIREDDDSAGDSDARIRFTAAQDGPYLLVAQAYSEGSGGAFTLSVEERVLPPARPPRPIEPGSTVSGTLTAGSPVLLTEWDTEIPHDLWTFRGTGGEHVRISLEAPDFDGYLEFGPMSGDELQVTDSDDDGGEGTNALLRIQLPHDGTFGIRARPLGENGTGSYTLRLEPFTPAPPSRNPIGFGETVSGTLTVDDGMIEGNIPVQEWTFQGTAGERIRVRMRSEDFDSYLVLGRETAPGGFQELASNDDAPDDDGLNSLVEFQLPADGTYVIRARSYGAGATGGYTLLLERP